MRPIGPWNDSRLHRTQAFDLGFRVSGLQPRFGYGLRPRQMGTSFSPICGETTWQECLPARRKILALELVDRYSKRRTAGPLQTTFITFLGEST